MILASDSENHCSRSVIAAPSATFLAVPYGIGVSSWKWKDVWECGLTERRLSNMLPLSSPWRSALQTGCVVAAASDMVQRGCLEDLPSSCFRSPGQHPWLESTLAERTAAHRGAGFPPEGHSPLAGYSVTAITCWRPFCKTLPFPTKKKRIYKYVVSTFDKGLSWSFMREKFIFSWRGHR